MRAAAQLMRYGNQDFFRIMGRDPVASPMSELETVVILACLQEQVEAEFTPRKTETGLSFEE